jgi:hypothetical protein
MGGAATVSGVSATIVKKWVSMRKWHSKVGGNLRDGEIYRKR